MCEISDQPSEQLPNQLSKQPEPLSDLRADLGTDFGAELWVFVYGTLKPGGRYHQRYCSEYLTEALPALVKGRLYDFPALGYPGMTAGDDWVKGYLFKFVQAQAACREILQRLDYLEGYREDLPIEANDYQRVSAPVFTLAHQPLQVAWVYQMTMAAVRTQNGQYLPNGNW